MTRWAYHIETDDARLSGNLELENVPPDIAPDAFDTEILVSRRDADGRVRYVGIARPDGFAGDNGQWTIDWFGSPVVRSAPVSQWLRLPDADFAAIIELGVAPLTEISEAEVASYSENWYALHIYAALARRVATAYGEHCALTGEAELGSNRTQVVAIRPREAGGALHKGNFLLLDEAAAVAFVAFHLTIGPGREILVNLAAIDPELLERLNPVGYVSAPVDARHVVDPQSLAWHRAQFFGRLGGPA